MSKDNLHNDDGVEQITNAISRFTRMIIPFGTALGMNP